MAYFGKEFKFASEDNYEAFLTSLENAGAKSLNFLNFKPNQGVRKDGDTYTLFLITPNFTRELNFKNGETVPDELSPELQGKSTFTVDGDTITQVLDFGAKGAITFKREYSADSLKVTVSASIVGGSAVRHYVPV